MTERQLISTVEEPVSIELAGLLVRGELVVPEDAFGLVLFPAGGGLARANSRGRRFLQELEEQGLATLAFDLLTGEEETQDNHRAGGLGEDVAVLASRIVEVNKWASAERELRHLPFGYFGSGPAAAAALAASTRKDGTVAAIVLRNGRTDLAENVLADVQPPTLLLVGASDAPMVRRNETALLRLGSARKEMIMIPGSSRRFEDSAELATAAELAADWFSRYLILVS
ncbi:MAG TPA: hypothetical protein VGS20_08410 [Candidatus Acidoferrales bacterium]|nr:hypothetical protein [Candidatus Acidoferrales bacterium]